MNSDDIVFPIQLTLKIIAVDGPDIEARLIAFLAKEGIDNPVAEGNHSANGKYITYNVATTCNTLEHMRDIYARVADIEGVKMVL